MTKRYSIFLTFFVFVFSGISSFANARFLQTDPVGYEDQMNLYAYVGNDPINLSDPSGRNSEEGHQRQAEACQDDIDACQAMAEATLLAGALVVTVISPIPGDEAAVAAAAAARAASAARVANITQKIGRLRRGARSLDKKAADHRKRAQELRDNPTVRPGMEGQSPERIAAQQRTRIKKLERDADDFEKQANRTRQEIKQLEDEL